VIVTPLVGLSVVFNTIAHTPVLAEVILVCALSAVSDDRCVLSDGQPSTPKQKLPVASVCTSSGHSPKTWRTAQVDSVRTTVMDSTAEGSFGVSDRRPRGGRICSFFASR
jgi:hypothetical protein